MLRHLVAVLLVLAPAAAVSAQDAAQPEVAAEAGVTGEVEVAAEASASPAIGTAEPEVAATATPAPTGPARSTPREVPDYDGRGDDPTTAGDVLLWIPRILFSPLYLVTEFVLRRPLGWLIATGDKANLPGLLVDFFTFGEERNSGFAPTALIDFGLKPSVGIYLFWDNVFVRGHGLRLRAATWGIDWLQFTFADRQAWSEHVRTSVRAAFSRRPDWRFFGVGPDLRSENAVGQSTLSRYSATTIDVQGTFEAEPWRASSLRWTAGWRRTTFEDEACCDDPTVSQAVAAGHYALPPGYPDGYSIWLQKISLAFDTRESATTGVRVELRGSQAFEIDDPARRRWITYGALGGVFLDLTGDRRIIGLSVAALFAQPLPGSEAIPFTELVALGGDEFLRGFQAGRLYDESAFIATFEYRWPVWVWLDGTMQVQIGNVLPGHLDGFSLDRMRLSATVGFRTSTAADHSFDFLFGFGTETFADGFEVSSFRLVIGTKDGF